MGKSILITGGAGYIGAHTNLELTAKGYHTIILDNLISGHKEFLQAGKFVLGDTMNTEHLKLLFKTYDIDAVIHFAAFINVGESVRNPLKYYKNNVSATLNLLDAMISAGINKIIFSSTCATYGIPEEIPIPEMHSKIPINPYGRSKLMIEHILEDYSKAFGLKYVSLRYFNAAGADQQTRVGEWHEPETHLIPLIFEAALFPNRELKIFGSDYDTPDGTCIRDYIHVTDLAKAHILALEYLMNGGKSDVFNLGYEEGYSVHEVFNMAQEICKKKITVKIVDRRLGDCPRLIGSAKKAEKILKWKPCHSEIKNILRTAWNWHKKLSRSGFKTPSQV